jgi:hypothetical protein
MRPQFLDYPFKLQAKHLAEYLTTGWRRKLLVVFFVLFSLGVITAIIVGNWELLVTYQWDIRPKWLLYALLAFGIDFFLVIWVWHLMVVRLANYDNLYTTVKIYLQANLSRRVPGVVWYIVSRAVLYQEKGVSKIKISLLSGLEMAFFLISGFVTTLLMLPFWSGVDLIIERNNQLILFGMMLLLSIILVHPKILGYVWQLTSRAEPTQALQWRDTIVWLILYIFTWLIGGVVLFSVVSFFQPIPITELMTIIGMWSLSGTISLVGFFTFASIGLREITLTVLLTQFLPLPVTLIIAVTIRLLWTIGELFTSLIAFKL